MVQKLEMKKKGFTDEVLALVDSFFDIVNEELSVLKSETWTAPTPEPVEDDKEAIE